MSNTAPFLTGTTTPGQSGPGSDGNEGVLRIPQRSSITGSSPSDRLSYPGLTFGGGGLTPSAEVQSVYSTAPTDWAKERKVFIHLHKFNRY